jgi:hypothetical protein
VLGADDRHPAKIGPETRTRKVLPVAEPLAPIAAAYLESLAGKAADAKSRFVILSAAKHDRFARTLHPPCPAGPLWRDYSVSCAMI